MMPVVLAARGTRRMEQAFRAEICEFLAHLGAVAAAAVLPHFRTALAVENKRHDGFDPVTAADREGERAIVDAIRERYPRHAILGEEFGAVEGSEPYRWVIDPIDGTRAFMCGVPTWGTLIALCEHEVPRCGLMSQPFVGEHFLGDGTRADWVRGPSRRRLETSSNADLAGAVLFATAPEMFDVESEWPRFQALSKCVRLTRYGIDCYAYCLLAAGHVDLVVEAGLSFYDIAPLIPIIEGAGGMVTDWQGAPVRGGGRVIAAANAAVHERALGVLTAG